MAGIALVAAAPAHAYAADRLIVGFAPNTTVAEQVVDLRAAGVAGITATTVRATDIPAIDAAVITVPEGEGAGVREQLRADPNVEFVEPDRIAHVAWYPGDPRLSQQWGLGKVGAYTAWDIALGSGVKVAVVDTGVSYIHPDLWGKVDKGWDYVASDADPMDEQGHGTHVAGIAAGIAGNATGGAGIAPTARILAVRVLDAEGAGYYSWIANGIIYAVDHGAKVINLSLGGPTGSATLENAVNYATAKGALVLCASGNDGTASVGYPARYGNCLAVGSTNSSDVRSSFSNHGAGLDLVAPGSNILSSTRGGGYESWSGTSMATPFASGVAALLYSQGLTRSQVVATIIGTARDLGAVGYDTVYGSGRIDASAAVARAATLATPAADSTAPDVTLLEIGASYVETRARTTYRWRTTRITAWRVVGRTPYGGRYGWAETKGGDWRRKIVRYRVSGGVIRRRITYRRKVAIRTVTSLRYRQLTASGYDATGVDRMALQVDGRWVAIDFDAADGWGFAWRCAAGAHTFTVTAYDARDNSASRQLQQHTNC